MQIGTVGKRVGLSVDAIRFYERKALLPRPPRTQGGFRQYSENDMETLSFIGRVQNLGFTLREVRDLLGTCDGAACNLVLPCAGGWKKN